jgi:hypothetical protein
MVSMLAYFYMDAGFISKTSFPAPIDFHLLRIMTATEMLTVEDLTSDRFVEEYTAAARKLTFTYAHERGVGMTAISDVLWLLSRSLCQHNPGTEMRKGLSAGRKTTLTPVPILWTPGQREGFRRSCKHCPLRPMCKWNVPSMPYYVGGKLIVLGRRQEPPEGDLFLNQGPQ